jgi:hypothetical protein
MKYKATALLLCAATLLTACSQDPARYDVTSPCVATSESIYLDAPCERRLPIENYEYSGKIAGS